jgi:hypothetical protein
MPKPVTVLFAAQPAAGMPSHVATRSIFADPTIDELRTRDFVDFCSAQETGKSLVHWPAEEARWWRAVSQRVPRDAYRRIAKTDVLTSTPHPGRRDAVYRLESNIVRLAAVERPRAREDDQRKERRQKPDPVRPRLGDTNLSSQEPAW